MKRELAFALEARSQFGCFIGRTRSAERPVAQFTDCNRKNKDRSLVVRSAKSIDDVHVNRRNKRVKTMIPDGDSVNAGKSKGNEESAVAEVHKGEGEAEVVNEEDKSKALVVYNGGDGSAQVEIATGKEEGRGSAEKVYVKRTKSKNQLMCITPKRFTRSALKDKDENLEELETPTRKILELKMSKKIGSRPSRIPTNMRELLETGLLEGFHVYYKFEPEGKRLEGQINGSGILCSCNLCQGIKVISPSQFEMHARNCYRHAIKFIFLKNGKSLLELIEICKAAAASETLDVALQTVISSLPSRGPSICTNCNNSFDSSSTQNLLICDSCLDKKLVDAEPMVASGSEVRASTPEPEASEINSLPIPSDKKRKRGRKPGRKPKSSKLTPKSVKSAGNLILKRDKLKSRNAKRSSGPASEPRPIRSVTKCTPIQQSSQQNSQIKITKKNLQLHSSVFQKGGLPDGTELTYVAQGKKLLAGYKWNNGIFCSCCNTEISASQFEVHAGWASRKKPYENIYISNGVSLHEYAVSLKMNENGRRPVKNNDDLCRVCWDGGDLLLCDGCPRSFHQECAGESSIPDGKWYCRYCQNSLKFDDKSQNALVAGRVKGIDPIEQIMTRCIRIVKNPENSDLVACILCRGHDFSKNVFNDRTVIVCDQCEREYHIGCLREHNMADLKALPKGKWYCREDCERINSVLQNLITREPETLTDNLLTILKEKQKNNDSNSEPESTSEIKFMVLSGKNATRETRKLLAQTVDIFHEGFDPIIDATSGRDFIPSMVYGRKIWSQDFAGMLCAILTIDSNVVTAGTLRVFGEDIAELPIVATSKCNQGKGYFQLLFTCIERLLSSLKVRKIVLPAAEEAKSIWTKKFGFETIEADQLRELRQTCTAMMTFKGTSMLQKEFAEAQVGDVENGIVDAQNGEVENGVADATKMSILQKETGEAQNEEAQNCVVDATETSTLREETVEAETGVVDATETSTLQKETGESETGVVDATETSALQKATVEAENVVVDATKTSMLEKEICEAENGVVDATETSMLQKEIGEAENGVVEATGDAEPVISAPLLE